MTSRTSTDRATTADSGFPVVNPAYEAAIALKRFIPQISNATESSPVTKPTIEWNSDHVVTLRMME